MVECVSTPWKPRPIIADPLLSLSNSKLEAAATPTTDRFIPKQLNFDTF